MRRLAVAVLATLCTALLTTATPAPANGDGPCFQPSNGRENE